jgi:threonine-phosphate decarboxylase
LTGCRWKGGGGIAYDHGGDIYGFEKAPLDFSTSVNPFGMPLEARKALADGIDGFSAYPDPFCRKLRRALSISLDLPQEWILCGNGAADLIWRLCLSLRPKRALLLAPCFSEYAKALSFCGCNTERHYLLSSNGFALDESVLSKLDESLDLMFICQPNNPTGTLIERKLLERIIGKAEELKITVAVDECFLKLCGGQSCAGLLENAENLIILDAFTKTYAMAGLRLGFAISRNASLLNGMMSAGQCWGVSSAAQAAGEACLGACGYLEKSQVFIKEERTWLAKELESLNIKVYASCANFLLIESDMPLKNVLLEKNILIRACADFPGLDDSHFRIGIRRHCDNLILAKTLKEVADG